MTIRTQRPTRLAAVAAATFLLTFLAGGPAQAGTAPWQACAKGNSPVYGHSYASVALTSGEFRFQACRTPGGSLERVKLSYVKRQGPPVDVALGWEWVTRDGKETIGRAESSTKSSSAPARRACASMSPASACVFRGGIAVSTRFADSKLPALEPSIQAVAAAFQSPLAAAC
jgi:hypothetical protein